MANDLMSKLLKDKRVVICCGSGGVGKTTTAAALALTGVAKGLKTLVLTIDPAKRLANSLGIESIDYQEREIPSTEFKKIALKPKNSLYAMMLDTKQTFDALIRRYATDEARANAILDNKLYQHLSNMMAGSQEYMAMEKLYEIVQERDYDLIVLDTPPSRHALDFLDAPEKMKKMIGDSVMRLFLKPSLFVSRAGFRLFDKSIRRILSSFDKVAGLDFLQDLSNLLVTTSGLLEGFQERAEKVQSLLHDPKTTFLLIASPQPIPLREADYFYKKIQEYQLPFTGFIFNRVQEYDDEIPLPVGLSVNTQKEVKQVQGLFKKLSARDHREITKFKKKFSSKMDGYLFESIPQMDHDIHDLSGLWELSQMLTGERVKNSPKA